jgi:hypothetical protein
MGRSLVDVPVPRTVVELRLGPSAFPFLGVIDVPSNISRLILSTGDFIDVIYRAGYTTRAYEC